MSNNIKIYKIIYTGGAAKTSLQRLLEEQQRKTPNNPVQERLANFFKFLESKGTDVEIFDPNLDPHKLCVKGQLGKGFFFINKGDDQNFFVDIGTPIRNSNISLKDFLLDPMNFITFYKIKLEEGQYIYECPKIRGIAIDEFQDDAKPPPFKIDNEKYKISHSFMYSEGSELEYIFGYKKKPDSLKKIEIIKSLLDSKKDLFDKRFFNKIMIPSLTRLMNLQSLHLVAEIKDKKPFFALSQEEISDIEQHINTIKDIVSKHFDIPKEVLNLEFKIPSHSKFGNLKVYITVNDPFTITRKHQVDIKDRTENVYMFLDMLKLDENYGKFFLLKYLFYNKSLYDIYDYSRSKFRFLEDISNKNINDIKYYEFLGTPKQPTLQKIPEQLTLQKALKLMNCDDDDNISFIFNKKFYTISKDNLIEFFDKSLSSLEIGNFTENASSEILSDIEVLFSITGQPKFILYYNEKTYNVSSFELKHDKEQLKTELINAKHIIIGSNYENNAQYYKLQDNIENNLLITDRNLLIAKEVDRDFILKNCMKLSLNLLFSGYFPTSLYKDITVEKLKTDQTLTGGAEDKEQVIEDINMISETNKYVLTRNFYAVHTLTIALGIGLSPKYSKILNKSLNDPFFFIKHHDDCTIICLKDKDMYTAKNPVYYDRIVCWWIPKIFNNYFKEDNGIIIPRIYNIDGTLNEDMLIYLYKNDKIFKFFLLSLIWTNMKDTSNDIDYKKILSQEDGYEKLLIDYVNEFINMDIDNFKQTYSKVPFEYDVKSLLPNSNIQIDDNSFDNGSLIPQKLQFKLISEDSYTNCDCFTPSTFLDMTVRDLSIYSDIFEDFRTHINKEYPDQNGNLFKIYKHTGDFHVSVNYEYYDLKSLHLNIYMLYNKRYFSANPIGSIQVDMETRTLELRQTPNFMSYYPLLKKYDNTTVIGDLIPSCHFRLKQYL